MRKHCAPFSLLCFSAFVLASCSIDNWLKKTETAKSSETKAKSAAIPNQNASASPAAQPSAKPTSELAAFKGDIAGKAGKEKLYSFLEKNDKKTIQLDLLLSDEQLEELNDIDKGKKWYFDLAYPDKEGFNTGGELLIDISKGKNGLRLDGNHLQGQIKIVRWAGPQQGLMSITAKPVTDAAPSAKPAETKPSKENASAKSKGEKGT